LSGKGAPAPAADKDPDPQEATAKTNATNRRKAGPLRVVSSSTSFHYKQHVFIREQNFSAPSIHDLEPNRTQQLLKPGKLI
jgi:hypothetical protein